MAPSHERESVLAKFPSWRGTPQECRRLRASPYSALLALGKEDRPGIEWIKQLLEQAG
jgi:hypothetical protein